MTAKPTILIVEARFYTEIADQLADGAIKALDAAGYEHERLAVPGVFEVPAAIRMALSPQLSGFQCSTGGSGIAARGAEKSAAVMTP